MHQLKAERAEIEQITQRLRIAAGVRRKVISTMTQDKSTERLRREFGQTVANYERCIAALDIDGHAERTEHAKFLNNAVLFLLLALAGVGIGWASERGETLRLLRLLNAMPEVCQQMASDD